MVIALRKMLCISLLGLFSAQAQAFTIDYPVDYAWMDCQNSGEAGYFGTYVNSSDMPIHAKIVDAYDNKLIDCNAIDPTLGEWWATFVNIKSVLYPGNTYSLVLEKAGGIELGRVHLVCI